MFGNDPQQENKNNKAGSGSENAQWARATKQTGMEQPATPSDSNSVASEVSNEDMKLRNKSDADVQSSGEGGVTQTFSKTELQAALAGLDSSLDPKRAKRSVHG